MLRRMILVGTGLVLALMLAATPALAQITTGTVSGTVKDAQGGVIPGATVVLDQRNARDEVGARRHQRDRQLRVSQRHAGHLHRRSLAGRRSRRVKRAGVIVSGGDRVGVPADDDRAGRHRRNRHGHRRIAARADAERRALVRGQRRRRSTTCRSRATTSPA